MRFSLRRSGGLVLLLLAALCLASCARKTATNPTATDKLRIGMMPKLVGISYFQATQQGAQEAADELDVQLIYDGPTEARSEDQQKMIDNWLAQGVDVIAVAPNDPEAVSKTLQNASQVGATVLTWDTDANPQKSGRKIFVNQAPNAAIADALVDVMVEGITERDGSLAGEYLIVSGTPTAANQNVWMELMRARIAEKHPEMKLLAPLMPGEDFNNAREQTAEAIAAHAELKGIWGITSVSLPAAAKAARDAGKSDEVYVTGLSLPSLMEEYVADGTVEKFVLWDAVDLGYLTVHVAKRLHDGTLAQGVFDMGRLKRVEITADEVILGPPLVFDKGNIGKYKF